MLPVKAGVNKVANRLLGRLGYRISRVRPDTEVQNHLGNSLRVIMSQLSKQGELDDFNFLQIGGFDGEMHDPIFEFIRLYNLPGIICEPMSEHFARLRATYRDHRNIILDNVAISAERGARPIYYVPLAAHREDFPAWVYGLSSFRADHITSERTGIAGIEEFVREREVDCVTLDDLILKHELSKIDLLQIDTEGYDFEILKLIDFTRVRPRIIHYEHQNLSPDDRADSAALLIRQGYQIVVELADVTAFRL